MTKTKTVLFAILTIAMILPLTGTGFADVADEKTKDHDQKSKNKVAYDILTKKIRDHDFAEIPLVMTYLDGNGRVVVVVDRDGTESKEIYAERIKNLVGPDAEVQVNVGYFERDTCTYRWSDCDPLYGGIEINTNGEASTLTIGATDDNSVVGFVSSSHAVGSGTGQDVKQGGTTSSYKVGDVATNPSLDGRYSDAAFVDLNTSNGEDTSDQIYRTSSTYYTVTSTGTPVYNTHIQKTGGTSGESSGYVVGTGLTVYDPVYGTLNDQLAANYYSISGDSGAPVYSYSESAGDVTLYGIHVGKGCLVDQDPCPDGWDVTVFSKWSKVVSELDLDTIP